MNTHSETFLKNLLATWPNNCVATTAWLKKQGISRFLTKEYIKSGWVKSLGYGAVVRPHENVDWQGGLWALQTQLGLSVHVGGKTAISLLGRSHFLQFGKGKITLFTSRDIQVPKWFITGPWSEEIQIVKTSFLAPKIGLISHSLGGIEITISSLERAILELIYMAPKKASYSEIKLIFENLTTLRPDVVQDLLISCNNYRVTRLFLYLAESLQHPWFQLLDINQISIGSGVLQLSKGGVFISKYQLVIPKEISTKEEDAGNIF